MTATKPDAVVEERHRREATSVLYPETEHGFRLPASLKHWIADGMWRGSAYLSVEAVAQSLANLEAAVRAEYAGVVRCARDVTESRPGRMAPIQALRIELNRLETLKNG